MSSALDETPINSYEGLFLVGREASVELDRVLDARYRPMVVPRFGIKEAGLGEHRLSRDVERVCDVLEHLRRRLVHPALELAQVRIRHLRHLGQLAQLEIRQLALRFEEFAESPQRF